MTVQIFNLRGVPDDEAEDIRRLLAAHDVDYYETPAGRWGMSAPALWTADDAQFERASSLIAQYQRERTVRARQLYVEQMALGQHPTLWDVAARHPVRFVAALLAIAFVLYFSVGPFLRMAGL